MNVAFRFLINKVVLRKAFAAGSILFLVSAATYGCEIVCGSGIMAECEAELELKRAELASVKSNSVAIAEITEIRKISSGADKGKYKVSFSIKRAWSRDRPRGQLIENIAVKKVTAVIPRSICNGSPIKEANQYWLFLDKDVYVDHFDIFYSYFHPRELSGFIRSTD